MKASLRVLQLLRVEGPRAVIERAREAIEELRHAHPARKPRSRLAGASLLREAQVVQVYPGPLLARRGGVPQALLARSRATAQSAPSVILFQPRPGRWAVRIDRPSSPSRSVWLEVPTKAPQDRLNGLLLALEPLSSGTVVHLEHPGNLPFPTLHELARRFPLVMSCHDYALFCPRVNLLEAPQLRFCGGSRDELRCVRCRQAAGEASADPLEPHRAEARGLLASTAAVVFPSRFARDFLLERLGLGPCPRACVIPPALEYEPHPLRRVAWPPRRIAFVGEAVARKGFPEFLELATTVRSAKPSFPELFALGGGDAALLKQARALGVQVLGYYRTETLPARLVEHQIDLAIVPSRFPETHCLALDGCHRAGVPTAGSALGALQDRASVLLPAEIGSWPSFLERLFRSPAPPELREPSCFTAQEAAQAHLQVWRSVRSVES